MNLCEKCAADCRNKHAIEPGETVVHCGDYKPPMTNGDRLRAMSDETSNGLKKWLQQQAEEG